MNVTSHDSGTYICHLENGLGEGLEVQTVLEVREERPATVVYAPPDVVLVQGRSGKVLFKNMYINRFWVYQPVNHLEILPSQDLNPAL